MYIEITKEFHYLELEKMSVPTLLSVLKEVGMPLVLNDNGTFRPTFGMLSCSDRGSYRKFVWRGDASSVIPNPNVDYELSTSVNFIGELDIPVHVSSEIQKRKKSSISFDESDKPRSIDLKHED